MKITNLDHISSASVSVSGGYGNGGYGGYGGYNFSRKKKLDIVIREKVDVQKYLDTYSYVKGNSALAEGDAEAYGPDSNAESFSYTITTPYSSAASATSVSQS